MDRQEALYNERLGAEPLRTKNDKMIDVYSNALLCAPTFFSNENALLDSIRDIHGQMFGSDYDDAGQFRARQLFSYPKVTTNGMYPNYNPPSPDEILPAMEALSEYISTPNELDPLIKVALVYYQLATIRPFLVGNGVIERICVNYLLVETGMLSRPLLCFSEDLFASDAEFRDALRLIRDHGRGFEEWAKFFLTVAGRAAEKTIAMLDELHKLRLSDLERLRGYEKCSSLLLAFYNYLWEAPVIEARGMIPVLNVSYNTVAKAIEILCDLKILEHIDTKMRYRKFGYKKFLNICYNRNSGQP
ncbi:Fic family protein [Oscillospiraceae bacterium OttesenSCG-928-G22]|nr:Fic family protein [Oscillospiraceae bacterium OttesenSCG-928-G22]